MTARRAPCSDDLGRKPGIAAAYDACGLALKRNAQITGVAMPPIEHAFLAVHAQANVVLAARRRLRHGKCSAHAIAEIEQRGCIVDNRAPRHQRAGIGADTFDIQARGHACEMLRMTTDRAHDEHQSAPRGIEEPACPIVLRSILDARRKTALNVFDLDKTQRAKRAGAREMARVARHRIRRIAVRDREEASIAPRPLNEIARLREVVRNRLVAYDVETGVERAHRVGIVRVVGRHDGDRIDAVIASCFFFDHLVDIAVAPRRVDSDRRPCGTRARRIARKNARDDMPPCVKFRGAAMHGADPHARSSADNAEAKRTPELFAQRRHQMPRPQYSQKRSILPGRYVA